MGTSAEHGTGAQISVRGVRTRKRRSIQEKLQIVQETLAAVVAWRHGINANQLFAWRRQYQRGELKAGAAARAAEAVILPVRVAQLPRGHTPSRAIETARLTSGAPRIEIEALDGRGRRRHCHPRRPVSRSWLPRQLLRGPSDDGGSTSSDSIRCIARLRPANSNVWSSARHELLHPDPANAYQVHLCASRSRVFPRQREIQ